MQRKAEFNSEKCKKKMLTELNVVDIKQSFAQDFIGVNYNGTGPRKQPSFRLGLYSISCTAK